MLLCEEQSWGWHLSTKKSQSLSSEYSKYPESTSDEFWASKSFDLKPKGRLVLFICWVGLRWNLETFSLCPQFIVIEFCVFVYVRDELDVFERELEDYISSMNQTGTLTPVLLQVKELINVTKGKTILHLRFCPPPPVWEPERGLWLVAGAPFS